MSIQIEVPLEALSEPAVSSALAQLMLSLGGAAAGATAPFAAATQEPVRQLPPVRRRRARPSPTVDLSGLPVEERWARYIAALPEASRRFLELLEARGELGVDDAVIELGLASPKAMGGLTGAMSRWAPRQGITLPYEAGKGPDGKRCWRWTGR